MAKRVVKGKAFNIAPGMVLFKGKNPNKTDDIDVGPNNPEEGISVDNNEIGKGFIASKDGKSVTPISNTVQILSNQPMLGGMSPTQLLYGGMPFDKVFAMQEQYKRANRIADDGSRYQIGGDYIIPSQFNTNFVGPLQKGQFLSDEQKQYFNKFSSYDDYIKNRNTNDSNLGFADAAAKYYYNNDNTYGEFFRLMNGAANVYKKARNDYSNRWVISKGGNSYRIKSLDENGKPTNKHLLKIDENILNYIYDEAVRGDVDPKIAIALATNESNLGNARVKNDTLNAFDLYSYWKGLDAVIYPNSKTVDPYNNILSKVKNGEVLTDDDFKTIKDLNEKYSYMVSKIHPYQGDNPTADAVKYFLDGKYPGSAASQERIDAYNKLVMSRFDELMNDDRFKSWYNNRESKRNKKQFGGRKRFQLGGDNIPMRIDSEGNLIDSIQPSVVTAKLPAKFNGSQAAAARYAEGYKFGRKIAKKRDETTPFVLNALTMPLDIAGGLELGAATYSMYPIVKSFVKNPKPYIQTAKKFIGTKYLNMVEDIEKLRKPNSQFRIVDKPAIDDAINNKIIRSKTGLYHGTPEYLEKTFPEYMDKIKNWRYKTADEIEDALSQLGAFDNMSAKEAFVAKIPIRNSTNHGNTVGYFKGRTYPNYSVSKTNYVIETPSSAEYFAPGHHGKVFSWPLNDKRTGATVLIDKNGIAKNASITTEGSSYWEYSPFWNLWKNKKFLNGGKTNINSLGERPNAKYEIEMSNPVKKANKYYERKLKEESPKMSFPERLQKDYEQLMSPPSLRNIKRRPYKKYKLDEPKIQIDSIKNNSENKRNKAERGGIQSIGSYNFPKSFIDQYGNTIGIDGTISKLAVPSVNTELVNPPKINPIGNLTKNSGLSTTAMSAIGAGINTLGSLIGAGIQQGAINSLEAPKRQYTLLNPVKLKTKININPQISRMREMQAQIADAARRTSGSSRNAYQKILAGHNRLLDSAMDLYGRKENVETELINRDRLNQQQIAHTNATNVMNTVNYNNEAATEMRNKKRVATSNNWTTALNTTAGAWAGPNGFIDRANALRVKAGELYTQAIANPTAARLLYGDIDFTTGANKRKAFNTIYDFLNNNRLG